MNGWVLVTVASLLAVSAPAEVGVPLDQIQSAVTAVIEIVTRPDLQGVGNLVTRRALLRAVADDLFDFPEMARSALGRHWATPSEPEREEFVVLFTNLLRHSYVTTIENYAGEQVSRTTSFATLLARMRAGQLASVAILRARERRGRGRDQAEPRAQRDRLRHEEARSYRQREG